MSQLLFLWNAVLYGKLIVIPRLLIGFSLLFVIALPFFAVCRAVECRGKEEITEYIHPRDVKVACIAMPFLNILIGLFGGLCFTCFFRALLVLTGNSSNLWPIIVVTIPTLYLIVLDRWGIALKLIAAGIRSAVLSAIVTYLAMVYRYVGGTFLLLLYLGYFLSKY